ncbi:MAG TPA: hypothetical protein PKI14_15050 [Fervidobacterium sp.]|nr:hypothetical protein [Fervidobacterium sp.]
MKKFLGLYPVELAEVERALVKYEQSEGKTLYRLFEEGQPEVARFFDSRANVFPVWERCYGIEALARGLIRVETDPDGRLALAGFASGERIRLTL